MPYHNVAIIIKRTVDAAKTVEKAGQSAFLLCLYVTMYIALFCRCIIQGGNTNATCYSPPEAGARAVLHSKDPDFLRLRIIDGLVGED